MIKLSVETQSVIKDLQILQAHDINAYGRVAALIKTLNDCQGTAIGQDLIDQLNMQGRNFNLGPQMVGHSLQIENEKLSRNLWRLKIWRMDNQNKLILEPYRVIYGFFAAGPYRKMPEIRIFAVPCRARTIEDSYDYHDNDPITIRIRADYDAYY